MKIECQYCGTEYDLDKHAHCPSCGANSGTNDTADELRDIQLRKEELEIKEREERLRSQRIRNDQVSESIRAQKRTSTGKKIVKIYIIIIFIVIGISFISTFIGVFAGSRNKKTNSTSSKITISLSTDNIFSSEPAIESATAEGIGDVADMGKYTFTCDGVELAYDLLSKPAEGYHMVRFHFVVECKSEKNFYPYKTITCSTNGFVCGSIYDTKRKKIPSSQITNGLKADGYYSFEIPDDAKTVTITYDNAATIIFDGLMESLLSAENTEVSSEE